MKLSLVLTALVATFALSACGSKNETRPTSAVAPDQTADVSHVQADPQSAESLSGYWMPKGLESRDIVQLRSSYDSSKERVDTHILGLNLNEELGYTFLATADKDELLLERNDSTQTLQALTEKTLNKSEKTLIKVEAVPVDRETLDFKISTPEKSFTKTFVRIKDALKGRDLFEQEQTSRTVQFFAKTLGRKTGACQIYELRYAIRKTECVIEFLSQNPQLVKDSKVIALAVESANSELVKYLLANGAPATRTDHQREWNKGEGLLESALANSWTSYQMGDHGLVNSGPEKALIAKMLIEAGAELNPKSPNETFYALNEAIIKIRDAQLLESMIQKGAKLRIKDGKPENFEYLFFDYMNRWGAAGPRLIELLVKLAGADPNKVYEDRSGGVIDWAIERADVPALKAMIANGADIKNYRTSKGSAVDVCEAEIRELESSLKDKKQTVESKREIAASIARVKQNRAFILTL